MQGENRFAFRSLLSDLLEQCKSLSIVISSRGGELLLKLRPTIINLLPLNPERAAELFTKATKIQIKTEDVCELIFNDEEFPLDQLKLGEGKLGSQPTEILKEKIMNLLEKGDEAVL